MTENIKTTWSAAQNIGWCMFIMNTYDIAETGVSAYDLTFGTVSDRRSDFPAETLNRAQSHKYVRMLDESLKSLTAASAQFQSSLNAKRAGTPAPQNLYQNGDLVLFRLPRDKPRPHKLHPIYLGPYFVILQTKNDVEVRHGNNPSPDNSTVIDQEWINEHPSLLTIAAPETASPTDFAYLVDNQFYDLDAKSQILCHPHRSDQHRRHRRIR
jgi:hypothetical protein